MAGYIINFHNQISFQYTNNKHTEKEISKATPLTIVAPKKIKYLSINLTKEVKGLYN